MAAPLSFPDGCRYKCGCHAGAIKGKSPSANVRAFADGDFLGLVYTELYRFNLFIKTQLQLFRELHTLLNYQCVNNAKIL